MNASRSNSAAIVKFDFHGDELDVVTVGEEHYVVLARLCEPLGLDTQGQWRKLESLAWARVEKIATRDDRGQEQLYCCLNIRSVAGWLFTVNVGKVAPHLREKLKVYQKECADALADHFLGKRGASPAFDPAPFVVMVGEMAKALVDLQTQVQELALRPQGVINGFQADDIRTEVEYLALALVALKKRTLRGAKSHIHRRLGAAIAWGHRATQYHTMPAAKYPEAVAFLRGMRLDLEPELRRQNRKVAPASAQVTLGEVIPLRGHKTGA